MDTEVVVVVDTEVVSFELICFSFQWFDIQDDPEGEEKHPSAVLVLQVIPFPK